MKTNRAISVEIQVIGVKRVTATGPKTESEMQEVTESDHSVSIEVGSYFDELRSHGNDDTHVRFDAERISLPEWEVGRDYIEA